MTTGEECKRFSRVFLPELNAIESRRRRYRIERLLGRLPNIAATPTDESAEGERADAVEATAPGATSTGAVTAIAGRDWKAQALFADALREFEEALRERDARFSGLANAIGDKERDREWKRAEALLAVKAKHLKEAVRQAAVDGLPTPSGEDPEDDDPALSVGPICDVYRKILKCEVVSDRLMRRLTEGPSEKRNARATSSLRLKIHLAELEQRLFVEAALHCKHKARQHECALAAAEALTAVEHAKSNCYAWEAEQKKNVDGHNGQVPSDGGRRNDDLLEDAQTEALDKDLVGLALSGGGIRSATFALGVLQGLAQLRLLGIIDYLSSVSGGGYIGSWFAAWIKREGSLANVERQLSPNRVSQASAHREGVERYKAQDAEPEPIHHLRAYSRYLSPWFGALSLDTWTLAAIYLRNLFVNALFFVPLAVVFVFIYRCLLFGLTESVQSSAGYWLRLSLTAVFVVTLVIGVGTLFGELERVFGSGDASNHKSARKRASEGFWTVHLLILFPLFVVALTGCWIFSLDLEETVGKPFELSKHLRFFGQATIESLLRPFLLDVSGQLNTIISVLLVGSWLGAFILAVLARLKCDQLIGWSWWVITADVALAICLGLAPFVAFVGVVPRFVICFGITAAVISLIMRSWQGDRLDVERWDWRGVVADTVLGASFGLAFYLVLSTVVWPLSFSTHADVASEWAERKLLLLHVFGMPAVVLAMIIAGFLNVALVGPWLHEHEREWRSRLAAHLMMGAVGWIVIGTATLLVPWFVERQVATIQASTVWSVLGTLWVSISGGGAWAGFRGNATKGWLGSRSRLGKGLMAVAPYLFLFGLLAAVSAIGQTVIECATGHQGQRFTECAASHGYEMFLFICLMGLLVYAFGRFTRVNRFSLHMLYANRLTRCYLGASRRKRVGSLGVPTGVANGESVRLENPFTGFDQFDDLPLADLRTMTQKDPYPGPLPLINCALNCLAGDELAYQDRRADSFVFTPCQSGSPRTGYAATPSGKPGANNVTLGRAMTISGAAVDPNMNKVSPALAALMTLLNTRLGWWLQNPHPNHRLPWWLRPWPWRGDRAVEWNALEPSFGFPVVYEFLGLTDEKHAYVHLSDGGHFENLGIYELIRRRCRFIIAVDAGTDRRAASDNMAAMMRLIRTDFGVRIELDPAKLQGTGPDGHSHWHCVIGRIRYDEVDDAAVPGVMVYVQACLTGDEPADVLQYAAGHDTFPRQSTVDQFFDEAQFECYRALGHHSAIQVFGEAAARWTGQARTADSHREEVRLVFAHLKRQWLPPPPTVASEWVSASQASLELERSIGNNLDLTRFSLEVYPELGHRAPQLARTTVQEFRAVSQIIQVMELAWSALKLDTFHAHPLNRGWIDTFRRWSASSAFKRHWPYLRSEYSVPFVRFCEEILNLPRVKLELTPENGTGEWTLELDKAFNDEWGHRLAHLQLPASVQPPDFISDMAKKAASRRSTLPFLWKLELNIPDGAKYCCGVICAAETLRQRVLQPTATAERLEGQAEFLVWLRGPHRDADFGAQAVKEAIDKIESETAAPLRELVVYHSLPGAEPGGRMLVERWMSFFFDRGFRRVRKPEYGLASRYVVLTRRLAGAAKSWPKRLHRPFEGVR